jgi:hypothetical protein
MQGQSDPLAAILGDKYLARLETPEQLTDMKRPLAMLDMIMVEAAERMRDGDCGAFRAEMNKRIDKLSKHHSRMMVAIGKGDDDKSRKHALELSQGIDETREFCEKALVNLQAEKNFVESVERVSRTMSETWKIQLSAANVMSQSEVSQVMTSIISIIVESLPKDASQRVVERIRREVFVNKLSQE